MDGLCGTSAISVALDACSVRVAVEAVSERVGRVR